MIVSIDTIVNTNLSRIYHPHQLHAIVIGPAEKVSFHDVNASELKLYRNGCCA